MNVYVTGGSEMKSKNSRVKSAYDAMRIFAIIVRAFLPLLKLYFPVLSRESRVDNVNLST